MFFRKEVLIKSKEGRFYSKYFGFFLVYAITSKTIELECLNTPEIKYEHNIPSLIKYFNRPLKFSTRR